MTCEFCGKDVSSGLCYNTKTHTVICDLCQFLLKGDKMNHSTDYDFHTPDGIVLHIKDLQVEHAWINNGATDVSLNTLNGISKSLNPVVVIETIREWNKEKKLTCSGCQKLILRTEVVGSHFAGSFCKECWENYKKENSRTCRICGDPMYMCCC
jgi:hypothetical protein